MHPRSKVNFKLGKGMVDNVVVVVMVDNVVVALELG